MFKKAAILFFVSLLFASFTTAKWFKFKQKIKTCYYRIEVKPAVYFIFAVDQVECNGIRHAGVINGIRVIIINDKLEIVSDAEVHNEYLKEINSRWPDLQDITFKIFR